MRGCVSPQPSIVGSESSAAPQKCFHGLLCRVGNFINNLDVVESRSSAMLSKKYRFVMSGGANKSLTRICGVNATFNWRSHSRSGLAGVAGVPWQSCKLVVITLKLQSFIFVLK